MLYYNRDILEQEELLYDYGLKELPWEHKKQKMENQAHEKSQVNHFVLNVNKFVLKIHLLKDLLSTIFCMLYYD